MAIIRPKLTGVIKVRKHSPPQSETECQISKGELTEDIKDVGYRLGLEDSQDNPLTLVNEQGLLIMGKLFAHQIYYLSGGQPKGMDRSTSSWEFPDASVIWAFDKRTLLHIPQNQRSPETPYRLERAMEALKSSPRASLLLPRELLSIPPHNENKAKYLQTRFASLYEICLFHDAQTYKDFIEKGVILEDLKSDVYCNEKTSSDAARISAGSCIDAGLEVLKNISSIRLGDESNEETRLSSTLGFCLIRPPGHHCSSKTPSGFCLINNIAVASACLLRNQFVLEKNGNQRKPRIAIIDLDVHFGEGTASFVDSYPRNDCGLSPLLYLSIHRFDSGSFYPFLDDGKTENTGKKGDTLCNVAVNTSAHIPSKCHEVISDFLLEKVLINIFFPRLAEFRPDLIFVSLGFDAAYGDPLGKMAVEGGFARSIMLLKQWCRGLTSIHSDIPVSPVPIGLICVLEGGYNPESVSCGIISVGHVLTFGNDDIESKKFSEHRIPKTWTDLRQRIERLKHESREIDEKDENNGQNMGSDTEILERHIGWCDLVVQNAREAHLKSLTRN